MRLLLVVALAAGGLGLAAPGSATAACPLPYGLVVSGGGSVPLDGPLVVTGTQFVKDAYCNDLPDSQGCSRERKGDASPARGVILRITQDGRVFDLAVTDAQSDPLRSIRWDVAGLPAELRPGPAVLTTSKSPTATDVQLTER